MLMITPATFGSDDLRVCSLREQAARPGGPALRQDELNLILDRWSQDWLSARNFDTLHGHSSDTLSGVHVFSSDAERGIGERAERDLQRAFNLANSESGVIYLLTCRVQTVTSTEERLEELRAFLASLAISTGTTP